MRLLLLICMIALTPLRAWAGDSMALQMAMGRADAITVSSTHASSVAEHANCAEHPHTRSPGVTGENTPPAHPAGGHCAACASCSLCFPAAWVAPVPGMPTVAPFHGVPRMNGAPYTDAVLALGQKPPIS